MPDYLIDIHMRGAGPRDAERAAQAFHAALARLRRAGDVPPTLASTVRVRDNRLSCVIAGPTSDAVRHLLRAALLPPARIREIGAAAIDGSLDPRPM